MSLDYFIPGTTGGFRNRILLYEENGDLKIKLDIAVFPVFCPKCGNRLQRMYIHKGSVDGKVGSLTCPGCGHEIEITDSGDMVEEIHFDDETVDFRRAYLLDMSYIEELDRKYNGLIMQALRADYRHNQLNYMTVADFTMKLANACSQFVTGEMRFETDERLGALPSDICHYIEFLYRAGASLPDTLHIVQDAAALPSIEGSAIWRLQHMKKETAGEKNIFPENS